MWGIKRLFDCVFKKKIRASGQNSPFFQKSMLKEAPSVNRRRHMFLVAVSRARASMWNWRFISRSEKNYPAPPKN